MTGSHGAQKSPIQEHQEAQGCRQQGLTMALTRDFRQTVQARAARDPAFRTALFQEAVQTLLQGDTGAGRAAIRDYINATLGFEKLGAALGRPQKSLMRMFGPNGNPTAENLLGVIGVLQAETGVHLEVRAVADAA
jgi:DNA-binding phage protein